MRGNQNWKERVGELRHVLVFLLGKFKGEQGTRLGCGWAERVVKILLDERKENCLAFCDGEGYQLTERKVEEVIHPVLQEMQGDASLRGMVAKGVISGHSEEALKIWP